MRAALFPFCLALVVACTDDKDAGDSAPDTAPADDTAAADDTAPAPDADGDGSPDDLDCEDGDPEVYPGADELCNFADDDCDENIDEGLLEYSYADSDGDGFGDVETQRPGCDVPTDHVPDSTDCDDGDASVYPGAEEVWYDGVDQNCDDNDSDADNDGYDAAEAGGTDCDDETAKVGPCGGDAGTAMFNCAAILEAAPGSEDGVFWVNPTGDDKAAFELYCDMTGGGWTLVMRGDESTAAALGWSDATGDLNLKDATTFGKQTWKLGDEAINLMLAEGYRLTPDGYADGPDVYLSADCAYDHAAAADRDAACYTCFADAALTSALPDTSQAGARQGLACSEGVLQTSGDPALWRVNPNGEEADAGDGTLGCDGLPGASSGELADTGDCGFSMWVR